MAQITEKPLVEGSSPTKIVEYMRERERERARARPLQNLLFHAFFSLLRVLNPLYINGDISFFFFFSRLHVTLYYVLLISLSRYAHITEGRIE